MTRRNPSSIFPRSATLALLLSASALSSLTSPLISQTHKVAASEKVTRAVGVYEWTGDLTKPLAARLVPITLFLNGHLDDAGVYLARPVPFTLNTGVVYSVEVAGKSIGTLTLDHATNVVTRHSATDDNPVGAWYGYGSFVPPPTEAQIKALRASSHPSKIVTTGDAASADDSDRPTMTRRAETDTRATSDTTPAKSADTSAPANPAPDDDPDRPTLKHRDPKPDPKSDKADIKAAKKAADSGAVIPLSTSLNDDPNRPTMKRGKPLGAISIAPLTGLPPNLHQATAVSDAANRDPHLFSRDWETDNERLSTLVGLEALAQPRLAAYLAANNLKPYQPAPATPPAPTTVVRGHRPPPAPPASTLIPLSDEHLSAYTLSYGGLPTFVYTAQALLESGGPVYLTMVVQRLPSGEIQTALASITDAQHLDRTPWLRLVDAVDPDAGNRASLLFELRAQSSRQFALYRLTSAVAEQTFLSGIIE